MGWWLADMRGPSVPSEFPAALGCRNAEVVPGTAPDLSACRSALTSTNTIQRASSDGGKVTHLVNRPEHRRDPPSLPKAWSASGISAGTCQARFLSFGCKWAAHTVEASARVIWEASRRWIRCE